MATGQNWDVGSGSGLRSIRKSSSVGFGELINNGRRQGTTFPARGQLDSARPRNRTDGSGVNVSQGRGEVLDQAQALILLLLAARDVACHRRGPDHAASGILDR